MRKEENTEKDELYGKLQVHFIENVEAEESSEEKESDSGNLSDETARKSVSAEKSKEASTKGYRGGIGQIKRKKVRDPIR